jgi:hypothetical protein
LPFFSLPVFSFPFRHLSLKYAISALFGSYSYFINLRFSSSLLCSFVELFYFASLFFFLCTRYGR